MRKNFEFFKEEIRSACNRARALANSPTIWKISRYPLYRLFSLPSENWTEDALIWSLSASVNWFAAEVRFLQTFSLSFFFLAFLVLPAKTRLRRWARVSPEISRVRVANYINLLRYLHDVFSGVLYYHHIIATTTVTAFHLYTEKNTLCRAQTWSYDSCIKHEMREEMRTRR